MWWAQADVMEQVHLALPGASITPTWAWDESTGKGVRVAVIDSGINANHRSLGGRIAGYVSISRGADGLLYDERPHGDPVGHGTACAGIIRRIAPDCELYSVRVVGPDRLGYCDVLAAGLAWAIEHGMQVCNLSLGTTRAETAWRLRDLTDEAYFRNMMLVAAADNHGNHGFPWTYPSVISVAAHPTQDPYVFYTNPEPPVEFGAPGIDVPIPLLAGWGSGTGNSYAAPHLAGLVTRILAKHPRLTVPEMKVVLRALSANAAAGAAA